MKDAAAAAYQALCQTLLTNEGVSASQMFGKPCLKIHGKAFVAQHLQAVVFKLNGPAHAKALALPGAQLWDPSGKARPMKEWVAVPAVGSNTGFNALAQAALAYVQASA
ncbi:hypothetical protein [Paucibacter sp. KBW04]|uniref:hypothetical protein n=1 Tax=Paucibacter sp. KBW04 TaxID=2153361 RepID=UPI0018CC1D0E|nr:hypothetical protein [Paucibacter sp. KBW04]